MFVPIWKKKKINNKTICFCFVLKKLILFIDLIFLFMKYNNNFLPVLGMNIAEFYIDPTYTFGIAQ